MRFWVFLKIKELENDESRMEIVAKYILNGIVDLYVHVKHVKSANIFVEKI